MTTSTHPTRPSDATSPGHCHQPCQRRRPKPDAGRVRAYLEGRGLPCWMAPRDVPPGANWGEAIVDAIGRSRAMVLLFSAHADRSAQVLREVERAVSKGVPVVPLRIENLIPGG